MQIYVDADACQVVDIVENIEKKYQYSVTLLCGTNHILASGYSEVVVVGAGADAVDYKLISLCRRKRRCFHAIKKIHVTNVITAELFYFS